MSTINKRRNAGNPVPAYNRVETNAAFASHYTDSATGVRDEINKKRTTFRQANAIWKDLALELMAERVVIQRWSIANGGTKFPDLRSLDCHCHAHLVVKGAIRDFLEKHDINDIGKAIDA
jgi:hypothetical protein